MDTKYIAALRAGAGPSELALTGVTSPCLGGVRPATRLAQQHPAAHEKLSRQPGFIAFQLIKSPARSLA